MPPRKKLFGRIALASAALLGASALGRAAWTYALERKWERRLEELRAFAEPARARRAARSPEIVELGTRLAAIGVRLRELHPDFDEGEPAALPAEFPGKDGVASQRELLESLAGPLAEWKALARSPEFAHALADGGGVAPPGRTLLVLRGWIDLVCWQAYLEALNSSEGAIETLATALDLAQAFDGGTMIDGCIRFAGAGIVLDACRRMLHQQLLDPVRLRESMEARFERITRSDRLSGVVENEILLFYDHLPEDAGIEDVGSVLSYSSTYLFFERARQVQEALCFFDRVEELPALAVLEPSEHFALAREEHESIYGASLRALLDFRDYFASQAALARVALAIEAHRAERGALAASLDELAWAFPSGVPVDPLTEEPFSYACDGSRARLGPSAWVERDPVEWSVALERLLAWEF